MAVKTCPTKKGKKIENLKWGNEVLIKMILEKYVIYL